jgi:hypothetical protein
MVTRLLDARGSDFAAMNARQLAESIRISEGRTLAVEVICTDQPPVDGVTHAELAASLGADILVLDRYDCQKPVICGARKEIAGSLAPLAELKKLSGRPVGVNLVVVGDVIPPERAGRVYTDENVSRLVDQGADIVFLINNPSLGGSMDRLQAAVSSIARQHGENLMQVAVTSAASPIPRRAAQVEAYNLWHTELIQAGCHGVGIPLPGTKQGWAMDATACLVDNIHSLGGLAWLIVTGSIEGGPEQVMYQLALTGKMLGGDIHRLDEAGLSGMPLPRNIFAYSLALRGERHTLRRMALH